MAVYGYVRVSTGRQAELGDSLAVQQRQLQGYALMHGLTVAQVMVEHGVSGSIPLRERPAGSQLLSRLQAGDVVISPKLDRVFRSALDALQMTEHFRQQRVDLHLIDLGGAVTGNGISKLFLTIAAAFAEAERDRIRERVSQTKADQKARRRYLGGQRPFGFQISATGDLSEDAAEQQAIRTMQGLRTQGLSYRAIAARMQQSGHALSHQGVKKILAGTGIR